MHHEGALWMRLDGLLHRVLHAIAARVTPTGMAAEDTFPPHSHSMVPGGLEVMSNTTRLTPGTSLAMRLEMRASTS